MEPQLFSCGLHGIVECVKSIIRASMEPQLFSCGLNVKPQSMFLGRNRFNGAATFQLRIVPAAENRNIPKIASMEPQLFSCGLLLPSNSTLPASKGFNGAATFQLRIVDHILNNQNTDEYRFNGAATFQLRIVAQARIDSFELEQLQWSRNFSVADWSWCFVRSMSDISASMEPQLFSCGLGIHYLILMQIIGSFNGAATFQLRIVKNFSIRTGSFTCFNGAATFQLRIGECDGAGGRGSRLASMEPQLFSCGLLENSARGRWRIRLQWSRNFSVADCAAAINRTVWFRFCFNGAATFQLRIA